MDSNWEKKRRKTQKTWIADVNEAMAEKGLRKLDCTGRKIRQIIEICYFWQRKMYNILKTYLYTHTPERARVHV